MSIPEPPILKPDLKIVMKHLYTVLDGILNNNHRNYWILNLNLL